MLTDDFKKTTFQLQFIQNPVQCRTLWAERDLKSSRGLFDGTEKTHEEPRYIRCPSRILNPVHHMCSRSMHFVCFFANCIGLITKICVLISTLQEAFGGPKVAAECLAHLIRIREVPGSNLGPETGDTDWGFRGYPQSLQANAGVVS
jgi:hypothetical protein